jgi:selenocysteine lyase/cysteine desulfurase
MSARGMEVVERRVLELRNYAIGQLGQIPKARVVSIPSGPMASALVAVALPAQIDGRALQTMLRDKYSIIVKLAEKQ